MSDVSGTKNWQYHSAITGMPHAYWNLPAARLVEESILNREGHLSACGALTVQTGKYTGRSPQDKFFVEEEESKNKINWGAVNQSFSGDGFHQLMEKVIDHLNSRKVYIFEGQVCADEEYAMPLRVVTERAWHNLFAKQLFIDKKGSAEASHTLLSQGFNVIYAPDFKAVPERDGTNSEVFVIISFKERTVLIGGTEYAGEMKKAVFTVLNYLLPQLGALPMHCAANVGNRGDVSLFFGLSGTGKTTLSADKGRLLVGDDEHGWHENGIFNFEGGCYAKCIQLKKDKEPQIYEAIRFGTVLENVILKQGTAEPDYDAASITENTRAAYPMDYIPGILGSGKAGHPDVIIFLAADAFGVLPPVSKLTKEQAMYHFISGYTSKLAGTERGVSYPEATFSACFGAPFMPLKPAVYDQMLGDKIEKHDVRAFLVNTGWTGGPYGVGERIRLTYTRAIISAIQDKSISQAAFHEDPVFKVLVPDEVPGVPKELLEPREIWDDKSAFDQKARELAKKFQKNFARFDSVPKEIRAAGPKID